MSDAATTRAFEATPDKPRHAAARLVGLFALVLLAFAAAAHAQTDFGLPGLKRPTFGPSQERATVTAAANFTRVQPGQQLVVAVTLDVAPGLHAQSNTPLEKQYIPTVLRKLTVSAGRAFEPTYPPGEVKNYPNFAVPGGGNGDLSVYGGKAVIYVPVQVADDAAAGSTLTVGGEAFYQICNDQQCFKPEAKPFELSVAVAAAGESAVPTDNAGLFRNFDAKTWATLRPAGTPANVTSFLGVDIDLTNAGLAYVLPLAFLAGIVFNIVPCVLPVLPLKAMGFYEVAKHDRGKCLLLGAAFSAGITATFAALAVVVLVLRWVSWGEQFSNPYFAGGVALVLVGMALYQFGLFTIPLPQAAYRFTPRHDTYGGNVLFGILTAILSTPCTFGLFFALLIWASAQPAVVGVLAVTTVGLGMASPYLVLSAFPQLARNFPRTGPWSELVKQATGFLLLAVAAYFARPLLPESLRGPGYWWLIYAPLAVGGVFAVAQAYRFAAGRLRPVLVTAAVAAVVLLPTGALAYGLANAPVWPKFSPDALAAARAGGGPVLVKFTADWCANCQTVERTVYGSKAKMDAWQDRGVTLLKADLTDADAPGWPLLQQLNSVGAIPFTAVYLPGQEQPAKLSGIYSADDLRAVLP